MPGAPFPTSVFRAAANRWSPTVSRLPPRHFGQGAIVGIAYKITHPNGKIDVGKDWTNALTYFGTFPSERVEAAHR